MYTPLQNLSVTGRAWNSTVSYFNRLPAAAESVVREQVWQLSLMDTGMVVAFETDRCGGCGGYASCVTFVAR